MRSLLPQLRNLPEQDQLESVINGIAALMSWKKEWIQPSDKRGSSLMLKKALGCRPLDKIIGGVGGKRDCFESWA
jgi:hypothetical protein